MSTEQSVNSCCVYRSLGVHISKVRSITLDSWEPEVLKVMAELGNTAVNSIYEYSYYDKGPVARPSSGSNRLVSFHLVVLVCLLL